jgi:hypothetical protein
MAENLRKGDDQLTDMEITFKHDPLDHRQPSIPLLRILPSLSPNALIQCQVWHTTIDASYMCLSYRWGDPDPTHPIEINGRITRVRQNLYDFLTVARKDISPGTYWIDALSIDQDNLLERNHQVAQMGSIFSNAACVHMWLGHGSTPMNGLVQVLRTKRSEITAQEWVIVLSHKNVIDKHIFRNEYFNRAWVTQEVLLARRAIMRLGETSLGLEELVARLAHFGLDFEHRGLAESPFRPFTTYKREDLATQNIVSLLATFRKKACHNPCDRVYSLLSLCSNEGRDIITVDYGTSAIELAATVLNAC